jgi:hypothetical protein
MYICIYPLQLQVYVMCVCKYYYNAGRAGSVYPVPKLEYTVFMKVTACTRSIALKQIKATNMQQVAGQQRQ